MNVKYGFWAIAVGTFALGIAEFGMMGILGDIAKDLGINVDKAGHLISAYSAGVAIGSPLLLSLRKLPLRTILLILAGVIAGANAFAALSPGFFSLLVARFIAGLPHGAFFGAGAIVCTRLAAKGEGAAAVAVMIGGMTVANVIGVPAATFVSNLLVWRYLFAIVALFGLLAFVSIRLLVPYVSPLPAGNIKREFSFLRSSAPWLIYGGVFFAQAAVYCWLSYISPVMTKAAGFSLADMTWIMVLVGVGMVFGNFIAGKLATKHSPSLVSATIAGIMLVILPLMYFFGDIKLAALLLAFVASACLFGVGGPPQYLIVGFSKGGEMLGAAGIQIAFNVSNATSAAIGGLVINRGYGVESTALTGIPFALTGMVCFLLLYRKFRTQGA